MLKLIESSTKKINYNEIDNNNIKNIYEYFDDWILVRTNKSNKKITKYVIKRETKKHIETINW